MLLPFSLLSGCLLLMLALLLPGHYFPWLNFQQEAMAGAGAAVVSITAITQRGHARWPWLAWVALAAACVPLVQWASGRILFHSDAIGAAAYLLAFATAVSAGATLARSPLGASLADGLTGALVFAAIASAGMGLAQWLQVVQDGLIEGVPAGRRVFANFGQPNHLALLLAMGMAGLLRWYENGRIGCAALLLPLALLGWVIGLTGSRAGLLFVLALAAWLLTVRQRAGLRTKSWQVIAALAVFGLAMAVQPSVTASLDIANANDAAGRVQAGTRPVHWQVMWHAALEAPWFGWGWQQVTLAHQAVAMRYPSTGELILNSHNLLLDLLVWNGLPIGFALFGALLGWLIARGRRCTNADRALVFAMVALPFVHTLVEFPLDYLFFLLPVGLLMGWLDGQPAQQAAYSPPHRAARWMLPLSSLGMSALLVFAVSEYVKVESAMRTLRFVVNGIGVDKVSQAPEPEVRLFDWYRAMHRFMLTPVRDDMSTVEQSEALRVIARFAMPAALFRRAVIDGLHGRPERARESLQLLCWVHSPRHCDSGRREWGQMQSRYPTLSAVLYPPTPSKPQ
jgi:O-antigen ligase